MLSTARVVSGSIWYLPRSGAQRINKGKRLPWKLDCRAEKILRKVASGQLLLSPNMQGMQGPEEEDKTVERRKKHSPSPRPPLSSCPNKAKGCASPQIKVYWNWKAIVSSLHLYWASISPNRSLNLFSIPPFGWGSVKVRIYWSTYREGEGLRQKTSVAREPLGAGDSSSVWEEDRDKGQKVKGGLVREQNKNRKWPTQGFSMEGWEAHPDIKRKRKEKGHLWISWTPLEMLGNWVLSRPQLDGGPAGDQDTRWVARVLDSTLAPPWHVTGSLTAFVLLF